MRHYFSVFPVVSHMYLFIYANKYPSRWLIFLYGLFVNSYGFCSMVFSNIDIESSSKQYVVAYFGSVFEYLCKNWPVQRNKTRFSDIHKNKEATRNLGNVTSLVVS